MTGVGIQAIAGVVPSVVRRNEDWPETFRSKLKKVGGDPYRGRGGRSRTGADCHASTWPPSGPIPFAARWSAGSSSRGVLPSDIEAEACRKTLDKAGLSPSEIDLLIVHSIVADELLPRNDCKLHHLLELRPDVGAVAVESICSSMVTQLVMASGLIRSGQAKRVLCSTSSCHSRISDYENTYSLYIGDAAAAFIVGEVDTFGLLGWAMRSDGSLHHAIRTDRKLLQTVLEPAPQKLVVDQLVDQCRQTVGACLARCDLSIDEIDCFISHQPTAWWHPMCLDALGLESERGFETFRKYANISACCLTLNLAEAKECGRVNRGDRVLLFAANAGYGYAAAVIEC